MVKYPVGQPSIGQAECEAVDAVLRSGWLTHGPTVEKFEVAFAERLGVDYVVACSSGTAALHLALVALGLGPGDEVLVPDLTFVASANAVSYTGARPILVDVDPETWTIDLEEAQQHLSPRTKAILPVHLYGVPCHMADVRAFAEAVNLLVIEDASEAIGGAFCGESCGTMGDAGTFSFYANKIMTTGEGGAVVTPRADVAQRLRFLRGQAQGPQRYMHTEIGFNYRMTEIQAALGLAQLSRLDEMLEHRHQVCELYLLRLGSYGYSSMTACPPDGFAPWLFTTQIMSNSRDQLAANLSSVGVETRPVFVPLHRLPMYRRPDKEFPLASLIGDMGLSLPTYADLSLESVSEICNRVEKSARVLCCA